MKDKKPVPQKESNKDDSEQGGGSKFPVALFIWLLVFAMAAALFAYTYQDKDVKNWDQSTFERSVEEGIVRTVNMTPEGNGVFLVNGDYIPKELKSLPSAKGGNKFSCRVVYGDSLDTALRTASTSGLEVKIQNQDPWFRQLITTLLLILVPVGILYLLFSRQIKMAGKGAMQFGKSRARMILPNKNSTKFDDVAGADEAKEETKEIMDYLKDPLKFKLLGAKIPKGAMLMGPPGTGKTLLAKAIAGEAEVPFFSISGSDFVEMFVGVGASRVRDMFEQARKHAPCLIFIDEIDAVGRSRFSGIGGGHDEREQTLNAMLVEMDGLETQEGVIVIAATNRPDVLDPALQRPGRFDRQITLDLPDVKGRRKILDVHVKNIKSIASVDLDIIARGTPGFSGADLANLVNEAALLAARRDLQAVTMDEMEEARDKVRWGRERRSKSLSEKERRLTAYHEAGHALVSLYCEHSYPLHKITIIPRGVAFLGATMYLPEEDAHTQSRSEMIDRLAIAMGGRSAEDIVFSEITSGAAGDIEQATSLARRMVCSFGMDKQLGAVNYGPRDEHIYVGRDITRTEGHSEATAREIDLAMRSLVQAAADRATKILVDHRDQLENLALKLLDVETLDAEQVSQLLGIERKSSLKDKPQPHPSISIKA